VWEELSYSWPSELLGQSVIHKTAKAAFLWVLSKDVQWSFRIGIMELLRESCARGVGDGLSYDFKLGY